VSIITPSLNQGEFIRETIESVLSQDYPNIEYIVIDGGSTDQTTDIIHSYINSIDYFLSEADNGQAGAINKGLKKASGNYIMWLNSDDILLPRSISTAVKVFQQNPTVDIVHGHSILFGDGLKDRLIGEDRGDWNVYYPAFMSFPQPSSFLTTRLINKIGLLDESLHYGMDFDLCLRAYLVSNLLYSPYCFSRYRIHTNSKSNNELKFLSDWREVFSRFINSCTGFKDLKKSLVNKGFHSGTDLSYPATRVLSEACVIHALALHLEVVAHTAYQNGEHQLFLRCISFFREHLPKYYRSMSMDQLRFRGLLLPYGLRRMLKDLVN
jgi:glycosyltransferase involved in cell wall biosynthesis